MRVYKRDLPDGVKKQFEITIGRKIKVLNKKYLKTKPKKSN